MAKQTAKRVSRRGTVKQQKPPSAHKRNTSGLRPIRKGQRHIGRAKGVKNKFGVKIKEAVLEAINLVGRDNKGKQGAVGYFMWLARAEPQVMGAILQKIMPTQVEVRDKTDRTLTASEAVSALRDRGLPVPPTLLSLAQSVGQAVAAQQEEDYEAELSGADTGDGDDGEDDGEEPEAEEAA